MTRIDSDLSTEELMHDLLKYQNLHRLAVRRNDILALNRHILKVSAAADSLAAKIPHGREALEQLLVHPTAYVRLRAAGRVLMWAPEKAVPVLGRLLIEDLGNESSPDERIDIRTEAKGWLYQHFDIRSFNRNDLIEPLRAYGIEIPYRQEEIWT